DVPEVRYTYTTLGAEGGGVDTGKIYVRLTPKAERDRSQQEISAELTRRARQIGGLTTSLGGNWGQKPIQLRITGPDLAVLSTLANRVAEVVRSVPGASDVGLSSKGQKRELDVVVDRELA